MRERKVGGGVVLYDALGLVEEGFAGKSWSYTGLRVGMQPQTMIKNVSALVAGEEH